MQIAYLIDSDSIGGGCEYIRRKIEERRSSNVECQMFYSDRGECCPKLMDAWGADEIIVNHLKALLQLLGNPFRRPKGRVTFVVHGIHLRKYDWMIRESECLLDRMVLRIKREVRRRLESCLYHRCDEIVALTKTDRVDILQIYGGDLNVSVEPNTLEGWVPNLSEELLSGMTGEFKYVCIGRFDYQKGQDRWIKIMTNEEWRMKNGGGRTLFIGDGPMRAKCEKLAADLGVADRCVFAGVIPEADRYLKCADIVMSPSRWEGMPYLMMKARALGCRILATDCPGNHDVLMGYEKWEKLEL